MTSDLERICGWSERMVPEVPAEGSRHTLPSLAGAAGIRALGRGCGDTVEPCHKIQVPRCCHRCESLLCVCREGTGACSFSPAFPCQFVAVCLVGFAYS